MILFLSSKVAVDSLCVSGVERIGKNIYLWFTDKVKTEKVAGVQIKYKSIKKARKIYRDFKSACFVGDEVFDFEGEV